MVIKSTQSLLERENFWIVIFWLFIFMVVLPWDQEKIVLLNLIIFCYFIYYFIATLVQTAFSQRKFVLTAALSLDLDVKMTSLLSLIQNIRLFQVKLFNMMLILLAKVVSINLVFFSIYIYYPNPRDCYRSNNLRHNNCLLNSFINMLLIQVSSLTVLHDLTTINSLSLSIRIDTEQVVINNSLDE